MNKKVYIFGHKNPDTDSISAAIGLAYLKNQMAEQKRDDEYMLWGAVDENSRYIPMSAGEISPETSYVLDRFKINHPEIRKDIRRQINDIKIKKTDCINEHTSIKEAWEDMNAKRTYTVPVISDNGRIEGIVTVGDIARKYMDVHDTTTIGCGLTTYERLSAVLDGAVVVGQKDEVIFGGKLSVAAAGRAIVKNNIDKGDIVIISENHEGQIDLLGLGVSCLILCDGTEVSHEILQIAEKKDVTIITTEKDTYDAIRLINQAIPVKAVMKPIDEVHYFRSDEFIADIKDKISNLRFRDFPVMDEGGNFLGMVGKTSLLNMDSKRVILVDHNEINQGVFGLFEAEVVEIIDHHKLATVETINPISVINQPVGCSSTIVYNLYIKNDIALPDEIAGALVAAIVSDTLMFKSPTCTASDIDAAEEISKLKGIDLNELWQGMLKASSNLDAKSNREIFYMDYKPFEVEGFTFGIGQVLVASSEDVMSMKKRMTPYLQEAIKEEGVDLIGLMITDAISECTELVFEGENSTNIMGAAFTSEAKEQSMHLQGVVSRKKQVVPNIMAVLTK